MKRMMDTRLCGHLNRGFAMMELILAIGLVATALMAGMMFLHFSTITTRAQIDERTAREIAFSCVETMRSRTAPPLENCAGKELPPDIPGFDRLHEGKCLLDVSDYDGTPGVKKVTVTVRWKGWRRTRQVAHASLMRQRGAR